MTITVTIKYNNKVIKVKTEANSIREAMPRILRDYPKSEILGITIQEYKTAPLSFADDK